MQQAKTYRLHLQQFQRIVILTGAGVSAASGLPTYRGPGGLWEREDVERIAHADQLPESLPSLWQLFGASREKVGKAQPNAAHRALARLQDQLKPAQSLTLITQNVDGLHQKAGSRDVVELHGSCLRTRCTNPSCVSTPFLDEAPPQQAVPQCSLCGEALRPDVVLFGEALPAEAEWRAKRSLRDCDLFLAVGTSGLVTPASQYVRNAKYVGAHTVLLNLTPMQPVHPDFDVELIGRAEELLPSLLGSDL
jgi:NAD-dependent deacetylase